MSIVMSTMAKQQQQQQQSGPAVFKLNAICAKLKRPDDDEDDEDDETGDEDLVYRHVDVDVDVDDEVDSGNCRQNGRSTVVNSGERLDDLPSSSGAALYDSDDDGTDFGLHYSAAFSATNDVETDAVESTSSPAAVPEASGYDRGGGRRNKRKNFKPRNIVYQYESCEDGEMDFPSTSVSMPASRTHVYASGNAQDLALRRCSSDSGGDCGQQPLDLSESFSDCPRDVPGPMDLSVRSHSPSGGDNSSDQSDDSDSLAIDLTKSGARESVGIEADQSSCSSDHGLAGSPRFVSDDQQYPSASGLGQSDHTVGDDDDDKSAGDDRSSPNVPSATDASTLKDYAESTMKELLGLYGFNDMAESLTKNVPLDNFSSGKILQTMTPRRADPQASCPTPPTTSSVTNNNQRTPSPHTHPSHHPHIPTMHHQQPSRHHHHHHHHHQHNVRTSTADGPNYDALCTKVVDSMAKLAHLPPNSIIGNPRVILPPNMTSTILTLAAMQESKFALKAPPLQPLMSHQAHQTIRKTQPSVIVSSSSSVLPLLSHKEHLSKAGPIDYTRYVKRYSSATECGSNYCKDLNYREHFHCMDCNARVFVKKEEMIRHFKWHKKRDESLQHGFLRFSPMDDCSERFHNCSHNRKQTHYHCLKEGCDKVYISTSDVQMHANYHRKDSAIIQEGFQRFRATEDCAMSTCSFYGQRTTHFHCRRANCNFTFKNKADMEKHKTYHIKDEQLNRDGFKKFMKHEHCTFESCRYSRVCNHIHCIRAGCTYVLHSSGQLYSHKRKHERRDNELAYRKYKLAQSMLKTLGDSQALALSSQMSEEGNSSESTGSGIQSSNSVPVIHGSTSNSSVSMGNSSASVAGVNSSLGLSIPMLPPGSKAAAEQLMASGHLAGIPGVEHLAAMDLANELLKPKPDDSWKRYLIRYTANDPCKPNCEFLYKDHYHCTTENCTMMFRSKDGVREHAKTHEQQDQVTEAFYNAVEVGQVGQCPTDCPYQSREKHYHCGWENCHEIILPSDKAFRRLDHYKMHDYSRKLNISKDHLSMTLATSMDSMFKRKRGRPPKNRVIEVWPQFPMPSSPSELPQAIFTSFKLPKPGPQMATPHLSLGVTVPCTTATTQSFLDHHSTPLSAMAMPFGLLPASLLPGRPSPLVTPVATSLPVPLMTPITTSPMQTKVEDVEGYYVFPQNTPCLDNLCLHSGLLHYHCMKPRCHYYTDKMELLVQHSKDFHGKVEILEGFAYFDRDVDCRTSSCPNNKSSRHYHCTRPNCNYSFIRYSKMNIHNEEQHGIDKNTYYLGNLSPNSPALPATTCCNSTISPIQVPRTSSSPNTPLVPTTSTTSTTATTTIVPEPKTTVIKATGTFYPLSAFPLVNVKKPSAKSQTNGQRQTADAETGEIAKKQDDQTLSQLILQPSALSHPHWQMHTQQVEFGPQNPCGQSFCKMKKSQHYHCNICNQAFSSYLQMQPHLAKHTETTGSKGGTNLSISADDDSVDVDDSEDGQDNGKEPEAATEAENLRCSPPHLPSPSDPPKNLHPNLFPSPISESPIYFPPQQGLMAVGGYHGLLPHHPYPLMTRPPEDASSPQQNGGNMADFDAEQSSQESAYSGTSPRVEENVDSTPHSPRLVGMGGSRKRNPSPRNEDYNMSANDAKKARMTSSMASLRILKDEPVPQGYIRYRFNEDCQYQHCGYREHQTHFHCVRRDCGYSFCDKTRFVQHTARHERLDTLMGGDFQQFRANVACGRPDCLYTISMTSASGSSTNKASHFHCIKCEYVCTDTNKVVAHRRQHQKLDNIMAAGFEKFTPVQNCNVDGCTHNQKQTHYHCMKCQYAVLGLSQMSAHKYRHLE